MTMEITEIVRSMLDEWLKNPKEMAELLGIDKEQIRRMTPEELIQYFLDRLRNRPKLITAATNGSEREEPHLRDIPASIPEECA